VEHRTALLADVTEQPRSRILAWSVARLVEQALWHVSRADRPRAPDSIVRAMRIADLLD